MNDNEPSSQPKKWLLISPDGRSWADSDPAVLSQVLTSFTRALDRQITPSRFVTIELATTITGFTPAAIRSKIAKGVWLEDRQFVRREGRVLIDIRGYEAWAQHGN